MTLLHRLGRFCAAHPVWVLTIWLLFAGALLTLGQAAGGAFVNEFRVPGAESQRALDLARQHLPAVGAVSADVVLYREDGPLDEPSAKATVTKMLDRIRSQPDVTSVGNPLADPMAADAGGTLSTDRHTALTSVQYDRELGELDAGATERLQAAAAVARGAGIQVEFRGLVVDLAAEPETSGAELIGLGAALVILLIAFGSIVAAGLPIVIALVGLVVGTALVLLVGTTVDIPTAAPIVAVMLGLGAGIDYALFVVTTFRRRLASGHAPVDAVAGATASAGHAVVFAGATVVVAILGLQFAGIPFIGGMGIAAALTVTVMVLLALTLLPALLGLLGHRVNAGRFRRARSAEPRPPARQGWHRWGEHTGRHSGWYAILALLLMAIIAAPVLALRLGTPDDGNSPGDWTQRKAYELVESAFGPGWNGPLLVVVSLPEATGTDRLVQFEQRLQTDFAVYAVSPAIPSPDGEVAVLTITPQQAPQSAEVRSLVHRIRDTIAPETVGPIGGQVYVGGPTAFMIDLADAVAIRLPWIIGVVVLTGALLLLVMFRAPLIAVKAAIMSLLSVGAAYGVLVAMFQWGWGLDLVGVDKPVPIMSVVPMLLFAVLFGLSMDYEVFLLSAIREEYLATGHAGSAIAAGLSATGKVITAAASIMAVVFLSFVGIDDTLVKMVGVGLATAVIIDATVLRVLLGPAVLHLLGRAAWWPMRPVPPESAEPVLTVPPSAPRDVFVQTTGRRLT